MCVGFPLHVHNVPVIELNYHLPGDSIVVIRGPDISLQQGRPELTQLTAFFNYVRENEFASTLTFPDMPLYHLYNSRLGWHPRKQGKLTTVNGVPNIRKGNVLSRLLNVDPRAREKYALRLLLCNTPGPTGWDSLKFVEGDEETPGKVHDTFHDACVARGLIHGDEHWKQTLTDAVAICTQYSLRYLFCIIIAHCQPADPKALWDKFKDELSQDHLTRLRTASNRQVDFGDPVWDCALRDLDAMLRRMVGHGLVYHRLPKPSGPQPTGGGAAVQRQRYSAEERRRLAASALEAEVKMNQVPEQRELYNTLMEAILDSGPTDGSFHFIQAPDGVGKTFLLNGVLDKTRSLDQIIVSVASTGMYLQFANSDCV